MSRYHISPETGNPGVCKAKTKCRFGDINNDHYDSEKDARKAFEETTKEASLKAWKKKVLKKSDKRESISKNDEITKAAKAKTVFYTGYSGHGGHGF